MTVRIEFTIDMVEEKAARPSLGSPLLKRVADLERQIEAEREIAVAFARLLMEDMTPEQIEAKLERFELICEQREISFSPTERSNTPHRRF